MGEEKELQESDLPEIGADDIDNLVDFADLGDLENVNDLEVFGELGDISDLGDVPDLSGLEEGTDVSLDDALGGLGSDDGSGDDLLSDLSLDDALGDLDSDGGSLDDALGDLPSDDESVDDLLGDLALDDVLGDLASDGEPGDAVPADLALDEGLDGASEDGLGDLALDEGLGDLGSDAGLGEDDLGDLALDEGLGDLGSDAGLGEGDLGDLALDDALDDLSLDALSEGDGAQDDSGMALDGVDMSEDGLLGNFDIDLDAFGGEEAQTDAAEDSGLGNMLDGILDNLDMGGTADGSSSQGEGQSQDSMEDLLGLDDSLFGGDGESAPMEEDLSLDMLDESSMVPPEMPQEEKKPGFFKRVFGNVVTDEIAEQEREAAKKAEEDAEKQAEEDAKAKEEKDALKAEKKAAKEAKAAEKKKQKEAQKAEKAKAKAEKKAKEEEEAAAELEVIGKLNKVGVCIIVIATVVFLTVEIAGTNAFGYISTKKEAVRYFEMGKYTDAYKLAVGTKMAEKDSEEYEKIKTVMKIQQCLNAYQNYDRMKYYPEALDALLRGVKRYDANIEKATQLEVEKDMMSCRTQIISLLQTEFNMTEAKAYSLLALDREAYQNEVVKIGVEKVR